MPDLGESIYFIYKKSRKQ